jgi:hypothetical protein
MITLTVVASTRCTQDAELILKTKQHCVASDILVAPLLDVVEEQQQ